MHYNNILLLASAVISAEASVLQRAPTDYYDYGELRIAVTTAYTWIWDDVGSKAAQDITFFHPQPKGDFRAMGTIAENSYYDTVSGKRATILVGLNPNHPKSKTSTPALKEPIGWTSVWSDWGSPGKHDGALWRPTCPGDYVSLGDVGYHKHHEKPSHKIWCLRQDLATRGTYKQSPMWSTRGTAMKRPGYFYEVIPSSGGATGSQKIPLYSGTLRISNQDYLPDVTPWVLSIDVPNNYQQFKAPRPNVTKNNIPNPGELYDEMVQAEVTLPMTALFPAKDKTIIHNMNSPFINISKSIAWTAEHVWENWADSPFTRTEEIEYGYSTEETKSMEHVVGVSATVSGGIKAVEYSVSLNYQFTHSSSSSHSEFRNYKETKTFTVNPNSATVVFSKRLRIQGTNLAGNVIYQSDILTGGVHIAGVSLN